MNYKVLVLEGRCIVELPSTQTSGQTGMQSSRLALLALAAATSMPAQTITTIGGIAKLASAAPVEQHNAKCVDRGKETSVSRLDTATNLLKNRVDSSTYHLTTIPTILKLPFGSTTTPGADMPTTRNGWSDADIKRTARYESRPVAVDGFVIAIGREGKESTNCQIADTAWFDYHIWVVRTEAEAHALNRTKAIVAEITPRVRHGHAAEFDIQQIMKWARDGTKVRVSGWLLLDPDHPDDTRRDSQGRPGSRGTIWEIHPVMKIGPVK
jgi:hypothetical protein